MYTEYGEVHACGSKKLNVHTEALAAADSYRESNGEIARLLTRTERILA